MRKQLPILRKVNVVAEPRGRDTCAAVTLGAALWWARDPRPESWPVLPADHVIPEEKKFQGRCWSDAFNLAAQGQAIVTIGIKPNEPATGYGYIQTGNVLPTPAGAKKSKTTFFKAERFVEKPHYEKALEYVNSGEYRWNAGMFVWSFITVTNGLEKHQPEMFAACQRWFKVANNPAKLAKVLAKEYPEIKKVSIDYALMEKAQNVVVADGAFEWDDLGAWPALARHLKPDAEDESLRPWAISPIHVDAARNIIFDARTKNRTPIAVVGLRDSMVADGRRSLARAQKSGAKNQGVGQEAGRGCKVEETRLSVSLFNHVSRIKCRSDRSDVSRNPWNHRGPVR